MQPLQTGETMRARLKLLLTQVNFCSPLFRGVGLGFLQALERPVRSAEGLDAAGTMVLVEHVDEFADRDLQVVAMLHVDVGVAGLQAVETFAELLVEKFGRAEGRVCALDGDDDLGTIAALRNPAAEQSLLFAVAVNVGPCRRRCRRAR